MIRKELHLDSPERLQSRPAAQLVTEACKYTSMILIEQGGKTVNVKSMMGVLSLSVPMDGQLTLVTEGEDEQAAADAIEPMVATIFAKG